jgi:hypothetical protein
MSTDKKYNYDAAYKAFGDGHIYTVDIEELKEYLSGVTADDLPSDACQPRADRMASVICSLIDSKIAEQNHKDTIRIAKVATAVAAVACIVAFATLLQGVIRQPTIANPENSTPKDD